MASWYIISSLLFSFLFRQILEGKATLGLIENILLVAFTHFAELSRTSIVVILAIFVSIAFWQTQFEYLESKHDKNPPAAPSGCMEKPWQGGCHVHAIRDQNKNPAYRSDNAPQVQEINKNLHTKKAFHGRVTMFPCDLRHLRRSGFKDDYHHSYLYVGYPVGLNACYSPLVTVEPPYCPGSFLPIKKAWFSIRPEDHAFNGGADLSMTQKLQTFLLSEGEDPAEWPFAYLLTPPSVTWQLNNPLAFWYLYSANKELTAMIVQLQTSYGERRLWLTRNSRKNALDTGRFCFRGEFKKDLQVSPFTPLEASYVIDSSDPCALPLRNINIMVTLKKGSKAVMQAEVTSIRPPLDAATASLGSSMLFLLNWWWVPMCTVVVFRILFKASKIYLLHTKKELDIQTRAEPMKTSIAKSARLSERTLEKYFHLILSSAVQRQSHIKTVKYITPGEHCERVRLIHSNGLESTKEGFMCSLRAKEDENHRNYEQIVFQVNTPTFYSRFFHYRSPSAAMESELLDNERTRTVWSSHPQEFTSLFPQEEVDSWLEPLDWRWRAISMLRTAPTKLNFPRQIDYQSFKGLSLTDYLIMQNCSNQQFHAYRRALIRLFLGHWIGGFSIGSIKQGDFELIGLSRDAILMMQEALLKAGLTILAIHLAGIITTEPASGAYVPFVMVGVAGLNIWACFKSIL